MKKRLINSLRKPIPKPTQVHQSKRKKNIDKASKQELDDALKGIKIGAIISDALSELPAEIVYLLPDNQQKSLRQLSQYCIDSLVIIELFNKLYQWDATKRKWVVMQYDM